MCGPIGDIFSKMPKILTYSLGNVKYLDNICLVVRSYVQIYNKMFEISSYSAAFQLLKTLPHHSRCFDHGGYRFYDYSGYTAYFRANFYNPPPGVIIRKGRACLVARHYGLESLYPTPGFRGRDHRYLIVTEIDQKQG